MFKAGGWVHVVFFVFILFCDPGPIREWASLLPEQKNAVFPQSIEKGPILGIDKTALGQLRHTGHLTSLAKPATPTGTELG